jgi:hypothetical protein
MKHTIKALCANLTGELPFVFCTSLSSTISTCGSPSLSVIPCHSDSLSSLWPSPEVASCCTAVVLVDPGFSWGWNRVSKNWRKILQEC